MKKESEWILPENLRQQEQRERGQVDRGEFDGGGDFGSYYAYRLGVSEEFIKSHAVSDDLWAMTYGRNLQALLGRMGLSLAGRVLDVGCAVGSVTNALARLASGDAMGIDISEDAILAAKERYPKCTFYHQSADTLDNFENGAFDVIHAREFYPFTRTSDAEYHQMYLELFRSKLRPGGYVVLQMVDLDEGFSSTFSSIKRRPGADWARAEKRMLLPAKVFGALGESSYQWCAVSRRRHRVPRPGVATGIENFICLFVGEAGG